MALAFAAARRKDRRTGKAAMQHRHFTTVAEIIRTLPLDPSAHVTVAHHFANELADTNANFDRARFLAACKRESGT